MDFTEKTISDTLEKNGVSLLFYKITYPVFSAGKDGADVAVRERKNAAAMNDLYREAAEKCVLYARNRLFDALAQSAGLDEKSASGGAKTGRYNYTVSFRAALADAPDGTVTVCCDGFFGRGARRERRKKAVHVWRDGIMTAS